MSGIYLDKEVRLDALGQTKRAGPYLLGPKLGNSPVKSMIHCLARKEGTNDYYTVKVRN
jgi:serine/threonine-protein kinase 40